MIRHRLRIATVVVLGLVYAAFASSCLFPLVLDQYLFVDRHEAASDLQTIRLVRGGRRQPGVRTNRRVLVAEHRRPPLLQFMNNPVQTAGIIEFTPGGDVQACWVLHYTAYLRRTSVDRIIPTREWFELSRPRRELWTHRRVRSRLLNFFGPYDRCMSADADAAVPAARGTP